MDNINETDSRREFLSRLLEGSATATVLMVFGPGAMAHGPETGGSEHLAESEKKYAYVIDVNKCIGCGNCVRACSRENAVPADFFRTWVERY
ncbi:MAG: 4Fe-4S binding protein, partial [Rhodospirillaceae bacterium]|nr:4Fe-4S binding protein [Rhodospirillaceae bacterium]